MLFQNFFLLALCSFLGTLYGFYLPGIAPVQFKQNQAVDLLVNALTSEHTTLPFDYYDERFHFCRNKPIQEPGESFGSVLLGDRILTSDFEISFLENNRCKFLCSVEIPGQDAAFINDRIKESYMLNWEVDSLPASHTRVNKAGEEEVFLGFPLGNYDDSTKTAYFHNHYEIVLHYSNEKGTLSNPDSYYIVGFDVTPHSYSRQNPQDCPSGSVDPLVLKTNDKNQVSYTFEVRFEESDIKWHSRWDKYLTLYNPNIHWFNLVNSIIIALFLTGMVAMILVRALHKDISRYNQIDSQEDAQDDVGWKLVHGDVFRTPTRYMLLSIFLGSGAQIFLMGCVTLVFAALGFLSPSNRGALMTTLIVAYTLSSSFAGYVSAIFYKMFGGENWKKNVLMTAFLVPGFVFSVFVFLNFFLIGAKSSAAVPFGTIVVLIVLWFIFSVPLCFAGAFIGFKRPKVEHPVRTNQIPRQVPQLNFYLRPMPSILMGGILPFGCIFIELFFILSSIWAHQMYYVFGILFVVGLVLILTVSEVSILMAYFQLAAEDYHWWWRSFLTAGSSGIYIFLYSIFHFYSHHESTNFNSMVLYFGWSLVISFLYFLSCGFIGFFACFLFVRKIYGSIKID